MARRGDNAELQWLRSRADFWLGALMFSGRLALGLLGLLALVIGGSAVAYWKFAHHRPLVVILGALLAVLVIMEAAYRRWEVAASKAEGAEAEVAALRAERSRAPIGPKHHDLIEGVLTGLQRQVERDAVCDYRGIPNRDALTAHFPDLPAQLDIWDQAARRAAEAPDTANQRIASEALNAEIPPEYNRASVVEIFARLIRGRVEGGHQNEYRVVLKPQRFDDHWKVFMQRDRTSGVNVIELPDAPQGEIAAQCEQRERALEAVLGPIVESVRGSGCIPEVKDSLSALRGLQRPLCDLLIEKQTVSPILFAPGYAFCNAQLQQR
jgi:hypothetical protein